MLNNSLFNEAMNQYWYFATSLFMFMFPLSKVTFSCITWLGLNHPSESNPSSVKPPLTHLAEVTFSFSELLVNPRAFRSHGAPRPYPKVPRASILWKDTKLGKIQQDWDSICQMTPVTVFGEEWEEDWRLLKQSKARNDGNCGPGVGREGGKKWMDLRDF